MAKPTPEAFPFLYSYASNDTSAAQTYRQRKKYNDVVLPAIGLPLSYDFWGEDFFYGRLSDEGNAATVNDAYLKPLRYTQATGPMFALNFVADAWRDFVEKLKEMKETGLLYPSGPYSDINAKKAFRSATSAYHTHLVNTIYPLLEGTYLKIYGNEKKKIRDIDSFLRVFTDFAKISIHSGAPMTLSGFVESPYCSPLNSGLVIDTSTDDHGGDLNKASTYLLDDNFPIVVAMASHYGFVLDKNAPWRFVADIKSPAMKEYMLGVDLLDLPPDNRGRLDDCDDPLERSRATAPDPYGYSALPGLTDVIRHAVGYPEYEGMRAATSQEEMLKVLFSSAYNECWRTDMDVLRVYLLDFYNTMVAGQPTVSVYKPATGDKCDRSRVELITRHPEQFSQFLDGGSYGNKWNLKSYYLLRRLEKNRKSDTERSTKNNLKRAINIYDSSIGSGNMRYIMSLRFLQEKILGVITRRDLTLGTVGDIL